MTRRSRRTPALTAALVGVLALGVAGCSQDDTRADAGGPRPSSPAPTSSPADEPSGTQDDAPAYATYVALGDSYTAAPLVPETDLSNGCLRSDSNYPALVAEALPGTELVDVSCSGADSASMVGVQQAVGQAQPPQFAALSKKVDLVTVGIGGNDFDLFGTLVGQCTALGREHPAGSPCHDRYAVGGSDKLTRELPKIRAHVAAIVAGIRDRAPNARVVVVGYPQIIPDQGTCRRLLPLATEDYAWARRINEGLARAVEEGARKADDYVGVFGPSAGHDICADDPWINGRFTDQHKALAYHPFAAEQQAVAGLVLDTLGVD